MKRPTDFENISWTALVKKGDRITDPLKFYCIKTLLPLACLCVFACPPAATRVGRQVCSDRVDLKLYIA